MNYNTDQTLWETYGKRLSDCSPMGAVSVTINRYGTVGNGHRIMAQFSSRKHAAQILRNAGFMITRALGCGHVKTNLNARYVRVSK